MDVNNRNIAGLRETYGNFQTNSNVEDLVTKLAFAALSVSVTSFLMAPLEITFVVVLISWSIVGLMALALLSDPDPDQENIQSVTDKLKEENKIQRLQTKANLQKYISETNDQVEDTKDTIIEIINQVKSLIIKFENTGEKFSKIMIDGKLDSIDCNLKLLGTLTLTNGLEAREFTDWVQRESKKLKKQFALASEYVKKNFTKYRNHLRTKLLTELSETHDDLMILIAESKCRKKIINIRLSFEIENYISCIQAFEQEHGTDETELKELMYRKIQEVREDLEETLKPAKASNN